MRAFLTTISIALIGTAIASAAENPAVDMQAASARIDELIAKNYAVNDVKPNPPASDSVFLRRVYLDIAGRIPTADEARQFLHSMDPEKRSKLIGDLLLSEAHVSNEFNHWADVLRVTSRMQGQDPSNGEMYASWIKDAIRKNMPYDDFVRSLVGASGLIDENGAVGFYLRDRGMPLDHLATTVQTFLGTQMVCAQCHDHPFDEWTQMDYYKLAAFSYPVDVARSPDSVEKAVRFVNSRTNEQQRELAKLKNRKRQLENQRKKSKNPAIAEEMAQMDEQMAAVSKKASKNQTSARSIQRGLQNLTQNFRNAAIAEKNRELKLPHDYKYDDAKPNETIAPATPFGPAIDLKEGESPVQAYAAWMTSPENPRFTKVIANRMWKRVMGVGLIEPVDKLDEYTEASNPELLAYLEELMKSLDYDLRRYTSVLYNTATYQREASAFDMFSGEKFHYPGPRLRRMSAEQVWDSLLTFVRSDVDATISDGYEPNEGRSMAWERIEKLTPEQLIEAQAKVMKFIATTNGKIDGLRARVDKIVKAKDPAGAKKLGEEIARLNADATLEYAQLTFWDPEHVKGYIRTPFRNVPRSLLQQLTSAYPKARIPRENAYISSNDKRSDRRAPVRNNANEEQLKARLGKQGYIAYKNEQRFQSRLRGYDRASELPSPAPDGHFLRTFGQSDRDLIENADDAASVPQSLALMNGSLFQIITDPASELSKELANAKNDDALLDAIYLAMLARKPDDRERSLLRGELEADRAEGVKTIIWSLLNTQQFIFVQ